MNPYYASVAERAGHRCEYCRAPESIFNFNFEVDHIVPVALDGTDDRSNLALACPACNVYKSNWTVGTDIETHADAPLYHPRRDHWPDHFRVNPAGAMIEALTAVGRVTVVRLQINHPVQLEARLLWVQLGLFP